MKEYFSHDHNARNDRKVRALVKKYKSSGYGIFWATNEMMHEEGGELEFDDITFGAISDQLNEEEPLIKSVINDCISVFKLYILTGEKITSGRVKRNLTEREEKKQAKSEKAASAGRLGGIKSGESRRSKQTLEANEATLEADRSNEAKVKESKVKEIKESKVNNYVPEAKLIINSNLSRQPNIPKFEDVHRVFLNNGGTEEMATNFFNTNSGVDWYKNGSPIINFSNLVPNYISSWKKNEQKNGSTHSKQAGKTIEFD